MARIFKAFKLLVVPLISVIVATDSLLLQSTGAAYRGKYLGPLTSRKHSVSGHVYAVDSRTLHLQGFNYDGTGPDAFFWVGFTDSPGPQGIIVPNERGTKEVLKGYNNADVTISLPDGLTLRDIKWFAVWCRAYEVNFGDIYIPPNFDYPQPHVVGSLLGQGLSSGPVVVVDAQTILVPDFSYDGQAPDLHFWVGRGSPGPDGIRVPDETGTDAGLGKADKKTLVLSLPGDLTIFDIDYFGVYSRLYNIDYGHVRITPGLNVPPSLRMLGISPQTRLNCEVLHDELALEVRWSVVGSGETIVFQLVGRIADGDYMSFGIADGKDRSVVSGGDVAVGWLDKSTGRGHVIDSYLDGTSSCNGNARLTPDIYKHDKGNNVRMLSTTSVNGFTILTYQRKLGAADIYDRTILTNGSQPVIWAVGQIMNGEPGCFSLYNKDDLSIDFGRVPKWNCPQPEGEPEASPNSPSPATYLLQQSTSSNIGEGAGTTIRSAARVTTAVTTTSTTSTTTTTPKTMTTMRTEKPSRTTERFFSSKHSAPMDAEGGDGNHIAEYQTPPATTTRPTSWQVPPIPCYEPDDRVYYAQLGPTGGTYGYRSITGRQDKPQEAWYINGLLLPEIYLVRHLNYTFVIQGGDNPDVAPDYNPFYITSDPEGGHEGKSAKERQGERVFAGVEYDSRGRAIASAVGKLCRWVENGTEPADSFASYAAYQRSLFLNCDKGQSGALNFTPDKDTPNLVYYQSVTNKNLGWKIHIVDDCELPSESKQNPVKVEEEKLVKAEAPNQESKLVQTSSLDQRPLETNHPPINILPSNVPGGAQAHTFFPVQDASPLVSMTPGSPIENPYLFAAGSNPAGVSSINMGSNLRPTQFIQQQPHQPQQQMPAIISLDANRYLISGRPVDGNAAQLQHQSIPQFVNTQGHSVVQMADHVDGFNPQHNAGIFQIAMDGSGNRVPVQQRNQLQTPDTTFSGHMYQLQGPLQDGQLIRRAGPLIQQQLPPFSQQAAQSMPVNQMKFAKLPDFYMGSNQAPLLSHSVRYEGMPMQSVVYATTGSPIVRPTGSPIPSILALQQQSQQQQKTHIHPHHPQFPELTGASAGQNPVVRILSEVGSPNLGIIEPGKYIGISGIAATTRNTHPMDSSAHGSRIAPVTAGAPPSSWTQARILPKREQKYPYFVFEKALPAYSTRFSEQRSRATMKNTRSVSTNGTNGREMRANDNSHEREKMDDPTNSHIQSSVQRSGPGGVGPQELLHQEDNSSNSSSQNLSSQPISSPVGIKSTPIVTPASDNSTSDKKLVRKEQSVGATMSNPISSDGLADKTLVPHGIEAPQQHSENQNSRPGVLGTKRRRVKAQREGEKGLPTTRDGKFSTLIFPNTKVSHLKVGPISGLMEEKRNVLKDNGQSVSNRKVPVSSTPFNKYNDDAYGRRAKMSRMMMTKPGEKSGRLVIMTEITSPGDHLSNSSNDIIKDIAVAASSASTVKTSISPSNPILVSNTLSTHTNRKLKDVLGEQDEQLRNAIISEPVYETFSPVFRPSPLDIDGFNVSLNFETNLAERVQNLPNWNSRQLSDHNRLPLHYMNQQIQGSGTNLVHSYHPPFPTTPSTIFTTKLTTPAKLSSSSLDGMERHSQTLDGLASSQEKRKFRQYPQFLANMARDTGGEPQSTKQLEPKGKALGFRTYPSPAMNNMISNFPPHILPPSNARFPDSVRLLQWRRNRNHPRHSIHVPYLASWQNQRYPNHPTAPLKIISLSNSRRQSGIDRSSSSIHDVDSSEIITSQSDVSREHNQRQQQSLLSSKFPSSKQSSRESASSAAATQTASQDKNEKMDTTQGDRLTQVRDQHSSTSWPRSRVELANASTTLTSTSSSVTSLSLEPSQKIPRKASITQGNLIRMEEESSSLTGSRKRNLIGWRIFGTNETSTNPTTAALHSLEASKSENEGVKGRDDRRKVGESGDEDGGSPDPLSLTLLTDIWQTINQDNGSKTPSQNPPAAVPQQVPSQKAIPQHAVALPSNNFQRVGFQQIQGNRQIPSKMSPPSGALGSPPVRRHVPFPLMHPIRRHYPYQHHYSTSPSLSINFPPYTSNVRHRAAYKITT